MTRTSIALVVAGFIFAADVSAHGGGVDRNGCHVAASDGKRHCHDKPARQSVCTGKVPVPGDEDVLFGRVVSVTDGDTFKARIQGAVMGFRMSDIDAPELDQRYGPESRDLLSAALLGKDVVMLRTTADAYGRLVVHVWIANLHVNRELVAQGAAWFYAEHANDECLFTVENSARDAKRGLWALPLGDRTEPWIWRQHKRGAAGARKH